MSDAVIDEVIAQLGIRAWPRPVSAVLERGLAVDIDDHLGYAKGDPAGRG